MRNKLRILYYYVFFETFITHFLYICCMDADVQKTLVDIGDQLKALRKLKGYNQADVMRITGVSRKTLSSLENGSNAKLDTFVKLLRLYDKLDVLENIHDTNQSFDFKTWDKLISDSAMRKELLKGNKE